MADTQFAEKLSFLRVHRRQDEASLLAQAVQEGIGILYREALIEASLSEQIPRERILQQIGPEEVAAIEYQRDALQRDVSWGMCSG